MDAFLIVMFSLLAAAYVATVCLAIWLLRAITSMRLVAAQERAQKLNARRKNEVRPA